MSVGAVSSAGTTETTGALSSGSTLSREEFLNILISEMSNQDPMNPMDNQDFLAQLVQLENLESTSKLSDAIENLSRLEQLRSAGSLIGRTVVGESIDGASVSGQVEKVVMEDNEAYVVVNGSRIAVDEVNEIHE